MGTTPAAGEDGAIASAIHLEFIRAMAEGRDGMGADEVESFHRALFLARHGRELERWQQERHVREERIAVIESRLKPLRDRVDGEQPWLPVLEGGRPDTQPTAPWNAWDRTMFWASAAGILCLLVFGVFNISFNLLESGIVTFSEHPARAYFWAALLPVGALAVKVGWDVIEGRRLRDLYLWLFLGIGLVSVVTWVGAYASLYPTLSRTVAESIASMSVMSDASGQAFNSAGVKRLDRLVVAAQALAEISLSAVLGMYMTQLYARHRPVRLARNPAHEQLEAERRMLDESLMRERMGLAAARGEEARIQNQLAVFVAYARSLFEKEAALRRDRGHQRRLMMEELAEHIRKRLSSDDAGGNGVGAVPMEEAR